MGVRKKLRANQIKEERKTTFVSKLTGCPTSPRKMRLVADLVRGVEVEKALQILKFNAKEASINLEKLMLSAIANWQAKNEDQNIEDAGLFVKEIYVDSAGMLKRLRTSTSRSCTQN